MNKFQVNITRHYYDDFGENYYFETYKEARDEAKKMVREALECLWKKGLTADEILALYKKGVSFPQIYSNPINREPFKAIIYAEQIAAMICEKLENQ